MITTQNLCLRFNPVNLLIRVILFKLSELGLKTNKIVQRIGEIN